MNLAEMEALAVDLRDRVEQLEQRAIPDSIAVPNVYNINNEEKTVNEGASKGEVEALTERVAALEAKQGGGGSGAVNLGGAPYVYAAGGKDGKFWEELGNHTLVTLPFEASEESLVTISGIVVATGNHPTPAPRLALFLDGAPVKTFNINKVQHVVRRLALKESGGHSVFWLEGRLVETGGEWPFGIMVSTGKASEWEEQEAAPMSGGGLPLLVKRGAHTVEWVIEKGEAAGVGIVYEPSISWTFTPKLLAVKY